MKGKDWIKLGITVYLVMVIIISVWAYFIYASSPECRHNGCNHQTKAGYLFPAIKIACYLSEKA